MINSIAASMGRITTPRLAVCIELTVTVLVLGASAWTWTWRSDGEGEGDEMRGRKNIGKGTKGGRVVLGVRCDDCRY